MSTTEAVKRLTLTDAYRDAQHVIDQLTTRSGEAYVTVEHTLNAKGDTQTSVKISAPMGHAMQELRDYAAGVEVVAAQTYEQAKSRYPRANGASA